MHEPPLARALGGRVWTYAWASTAALACTALFGVLADSGWGPLQALAGALLGAGGVLLAGIAVQQRRQKVTP